MPRPKQNRKICTPPKMVGFRPFGMSRSNLKAKILCIDEFEAIRLMDYEGLNQEQAAKQMQVSRPTLTRIYENARKVVASAFVEGAVLVIQGGEVVFDNEWFRCKRCFKLIEGLERHKRCGNCNNFCSDELVPILPKNE